MNEPKLITRLEWDKLNPTQKGFVVYMQGCLPGSELKGLTNPFIRGSSQWRDYESGGIRAAMCAQEGDD